MKTGGKTKIILKKLSLKSMYEKRIKGDNPWCIYASQKNTEQDLT